MVSHVYGSFAKWYMAKLKAKPYLINVGSGLVLMSTGDVLAQKVEVGKASTEKEPNQTITDDMKGNDHITAAAVGTKCDDDSDAGSAAVVPFVEDVDTFRTCKMAAWSLIFTPFYVGVYKMYDRYLPKKSIPSIAARVGLSVIVSIPINFAFYTYGNFVQHTADWYTELTRNQALMNANTDSGNHNHHRVDVPYRFDELIVKTQRKLEAELLTTIRTSAMFWIPINFLSFTVVPSHMQPLSLMFFSIFWNCYLSMSQHRHVEMVDNGRTLSVKSSSLSQSDVSKISPGKSSPRKNADS